MIAKIVENLNKNVIYKIYIFAIIVYMLPLISLGIFIIEQFTKNETDMLFWVVFLLGMLPCSLLGLVLSALGFRESIKRRNTLNKYIGLVGILGGLIYFGGGVLGLMLLYVVVGG